MLSTSHDSDSIHHVRSRISYTPRWQKFTSHAPLSLTLPPLSSVDSTTSDPTMSINHNDYNRQYSHIYSARLKMLGPRCLQAALDYQNQMPQEDGPAQVVPNVIEIKDHQLSIVVGVLVKNTPSRSARESLGGYHATTMEEMSYLGEPYEDGNEPNQGGNKKRAWQCLRSYCSSTGTDSVVLEDHSGRIELTPFQLVLDRSFTGSEGFLKEEEEAMRRSQYKGLSCPHCLDVDALATGVVAAVIGKMRPDTGIMEVQSIHFPPPPSPYISITPMPRSETDMEVELEVNCSSSHEPMKKTDDSRYIMFLSGLYCGAPDNSPTGSSLLLLREMLMSYLLGDVDPDVASKICRVIIAGGGCAKPPRPGSFEGSSPYGSWSTSAPKVAGGKERASALKISAMNAVALPVRELDLFLSELCAVGLPVDFIPGLHDPTNAHWPQAGLHACLLPTATRYVDMFHSCPNPYEAIIGDKLVIGSDGGNIADLRKFLASSSKLSDANMEDLSRPLHPTSEIDTLHSSLLFSHMAPTGPDSLPMYPANELDPFVMENTPHIYFAGNCDHFESRQVHRICDDGRETNTRLLCIPSFAETGQAVLVDLSTMDCKVLQFDDICNSQHGDEKKMDD